MAETSFFQTVRSEVAGLDVSPRALRQFGWTVGPVLAGGAALWAWRHAWDWGPVGTAVAVAGLALVAVASVAPTALRAVHRGWMTLAFSMGFVMTRVILSLAFFLIFVPIGLALRLVGKDLLSRRLDPGAESYWVRRDDGRADRESLERYF